MQISNENKFFNLSTHAYRRPKEVLRPSICLKAGIRRLTVRVTEIVFMNNILVWEFVEPFQLYSDRTVLKVTVHKDLPYLPFFELLSIRWEGREANPQFSISSFCLVITFLKSMLNVCDLAFLYSYFVMVCVCVCVCVCMYYVRMFVCMYLCTYVLCIMYVCMYVCI